MAQAGADEHQGGIAIGKGAHNTGTPANLTVEAFNDVVRANPRPPNSANPNTLFFVKHCFGFVLIVEEV